MAVRTEPLTEHCAVVTAPIDLGDLASRVRTDGSGAVALFAGVVRDHHRGLHVESIEYEAYAPMAEREMRSIAADARARWDVQGIGIVHRTGRLEVGETSVAVAVSAAHRREALEACRYVIDRLKQSVPVWKKEHGEAGEGWVLGDEASRPAPAIPLPAANRSSRRRVEV
jgi:molybdopterin synthase catalytic subunit